MDPMSQIFNLNRLSLKEINRHKLFAAIYQNPHMPKLQLSRILDISLSTIDSNVKILLEEGLIEASGQLESTGGRKATGYVVNRFAKVALGVFISSNEALIIAVDLNGVEIARDRLELKYQQGDEYFAALSAKVNEFVDAQSAYFTSKNILGLSCAVQGLLSPEQDQVAYGQLLNNYNLTLSYIQQHFAWPCSLHHDAKAAAFAELWEHKDENIRNATMYLLNENFGGALILERMVHYGNRGYGGIIEHVKVANQGRKCYCGAYDCIEVYCSKSAIEHDSGLSLEKFFEVLRKEQAIDKANGVPSTAGSRPLNITVEELKAMSEGERVKTIWRVCLEKLGYSIRNINKLIDGQIIISGSIAFYMNDYDIECIISNANRHNAFRLTKEEFLVSRRSNIIVALGGARYLINAYLECFNANPFNDHKYNRHTLTLNIS